MEGHSKKHRAGALLHAATVALHPYLPLEQAHSLTSQEKEWLDEPPSAPTPMEALFLPLFLVQVDVVQVGVVHH